MIYLMTQITGILLVVFALGMLVGFFACKICKCSTKNKQPSEPDFKIRDTLDDSLLAGDILEDDDLDLDVPYEIPTDTTSHSVTGPSDPDIASFEEENIDVSGIPDITDLDTPIDLDSDLYGIQTLEGIGPRTGDLFRGIGIATVGDYLRKLHHPAIREKTAKQLSIKAEPLHEWASMSDLLRITGIDHQYAELTYASGINTVGELAASEAGKLRTTMEDVNNAGPQLISPKVPTEEEVDGWIKLAQGMKPVIQA